MLMEKGRRVMEKPEQQPVLHIPEEHLTELAASGD